MQNSTPTNSGRRLLTTKDAARYLGRTPAALRAQRCAGPRPNGAPPIPYVKIGKRVYYDLHVLDEYIAHHRVEPVDHD